MELKMTKEQANFIYEIGRDAGECVGFMGFEINQKEEHIEVIEKFLMYSMEIGAAFRPESFRITKYLIRTNGACTTTRYDDVEDAAFVEMQKEYDEKQP